MGWSYSSRTPTVKSVADEVLKSMGPRYKVIAHASKKYGRVLYTVWEKTAHAEGDNSYPVGHRFIGVTLINTYVENGVRWGGHKDMDECMGPTEDDCPLHFFDLVPEPDCQYAKGWRQRCRDKAAQQLARSRQTFSIGDDVTVYGKHYTIVGTHKKSFIIQSDSGQQYKCGASKMTPYVRQLTQA